MLERIPFNTLYPFVGKIISPSQFGFMKGRSTISQLTLYLDEIYKAYDKDDVFWLNLDFRKAFDCVKHSILLKKLGSFGVRGNLLRLLASYFTNREYCVKAESYLSSWASVSSSSTGIDFGPLLFLVFINDLPSAGVSNYYLFADDGKAMNNDLKTSQN